jgi:hypothetical protein
MRKMLLLGLVVVFAFSLASAQSNRLVYGPIVGDDAGDIWAPTAGQDVDVEMWVRTDPTNEVPIVGINHSLMTEDAAIGERYEGEDGVTLEPAYAMPNWESTWLDGPFIHDASDPQPIPEGHTSQSAVALWIVFLDPVGDPLDTGGDWDFYGTYTMATNESAFGEYDPLSSGWYPHSGQGTSWSFEAPPGGGIAPEEDYATFFIGLSSVDGEDNLPVEFSLVQNYPNPFNASTTIEFKLPEAADVSIQIYDILGRNIETLISGSQSAGNHSVVWHADNQPSGVYFYRINAGNFSDQKSCLLLK